MQILSGPGKSSTGSDFRKNYQYLRTVKEVAQYSVRVNGARNVSLSHNGTQWASFIDNRIEAVGGIGTTTLDSERNQILNVIELIHGATYIVDNYVTYTIDQYGRVSAIQATLQRASTPYRRDGKLQGMGNSSLQRGGNGAPKDNGGHMIGARFNGPVELINYHAMDAATNQHGAWKRMEDEWDATLTGNNPQTVQVVIRPQFNGNSKRPFRFDVRFQYGNRQPEDRQLANP